MARYIDADALKTDILMKYKKNWEVPCSSEDRIVQRVVTDLRVLIEKNTPADVVPRERYNRAMDGLKAVLEERAEDKVEVAREIFEEIDYVTKEHASGDIDDHWLYVRLAELKKKYTGG